MAGVSGTGYHVSLFYVTLSIDRLILRIDNRQEKHHKMTEKHENNPEKTDEAQNSGNLHSYHVQFRTGGQISTVIGPIEDLISGDTVMIKTDHGLEPAVIKERVPITPKRENAGEDNWLARRANREEIEKYNHLPEREGQAHETCIRLIAKHNLTMKLVRVERYFNGSKIIFYFTAENRVDFRGLVKDLVQEFRTRVEIRQIGVRHETMMIGGLGPCGRELCCSSFINDFNPVSIKMAKAQNLPLNPGKISGLCNRLLCCLNYEFDTYRELRRGMPKIGKGIELDGTRYKVVQASILGQTLSVIEPGIPDSGRTLNREEWQRATPAHPADQKQGKPSKKKPPRKPRKPHKK